MKRRILILSHDNKIGDAIVMTGLFKPLRAHWPDCEIGVLCGATNAALYQYHPEVKWLHVSSSRNVFARMWASLKARWVGYDMVVHFGLDLANPSVQIVLNMVNAKQRYLFLPHPVKPMPNDVVMAGDWGYSPNTKAQHYSARHLRFLQTLGVTTGPYAYDIHLGPDTPSAPATTPTAHDSPLMVINSQSSTANRSLSVSWLRVFLVEMIRQYPNFRIQLLSASPAHEAEQKKHFSDLASQVTVSTCHPSVRHSLAVIQVADVVLSPDTYAVHAAGAWNIPVIALYEPSSDTLDLWAPASDTYVQICAPDGAPVNSIGTQDVLAALNQVLAYPNTRKRVHLKAN